MPEENVKGREFKFATHVPKDVSGGRDFHIVKEVLHYEDGTVKPNLRMIYDFERPFYITKQPYRNHKQKKEYELLSKVNRYMTTESDLVKNVAMRLGKHPRMVKSKRDILSDPYVYWLDISSCSILNAAYAKKYPDFITPYSYAVLDIEANIDTKDLTILTIMFKRMIRTFIWNDYDSRVRDTKEIRDKLRKLYIEHTPKGTPDNFRDVDIEYYYRDTQIDMIVEAFRFLHEWKPDFLGVWNIDYDISIMMKIIKNCGMSYEDVFCDPAVPKQYRYFKYVKGPTVKKKETGEEQTLKPHERWNYCISTASFTMVDSMQVYNFVRAGQQQVPGGYGFDNILRKETNVHKLEFKDVGAVPGSPDWHRLMTKKFPLEYIVYNQWDNVDMLILDDNIKDMQSSLPTLCGITEISNFNSSPRKVVDDLHFFYLERGCVLGTKDPKADKDGILGKRDWIVTLPSSRLEENGLKCLDGLDKVRTSLRAFVYDVDAISSYPNNILSSNMSKSTTKNELVAIEGMTKHEFMYENIDLVCGDVNAMKYCQTMMEFPDLHEFA